VSGDSGHRLWTLPPAPSLPPFLPPPSRRGNIAHCGPLKVLAIVSGDTTVLIRWPQLSATAIVRPCPAWHGRLCLFTSVAHTVAVRGAVSSTSRFVYLLFARDWKGALSPYWVQSTLILSSRDTRSTSRSNLDEPTSHYNESWLHSFTSGLSSKKWTFKSGLKCFGLPLNRRSQAKRWDQLWSTCHFGDI